MGEVKGGDFASCRQIWRMARHVKPKTDQLTAFFGSRPSQKAAAVTKRKTRRRTSPGSKSLD
jgi:hypothetical protein